LFIILILLSLRGKEVNEQAAKRIANFRFDDKRGKYIVLLCIEFIRCCGMIDFWKFLAKEVVLDGEEAGDGENAGEWGQEE
jgi:hypothetical protein